MRGCARRVKYEGKEGNKELEKLGRKKEINKKKQKI